MCDLSLETQGFFPGRGRGWRQWEDAFLQDFASELGLRVSSEQLRRPPAEVALRISWLGIRLPEDKASLARQAQPPKLAKKPAASSGVKAEAPEGYMTCAQVAGLAGCRTSVVYSAIWKKRLDALQGDRGVWLVPEDAGREFAEQKKAKAPKEASERPAGAKEGSRQTICRQRRKTRHSPPTDAQKGHASEISPELPFTAAQPAEARCHAAHESAPVKGPSPQAMNLEAMSKLDILKALAAGKDLGGVRA